MIIIKGLIGVLVHMGWLYALLIMPGSLVDGAWVRAEILFGVYGALLLGTTITLAVIDPESLAAPDSLSMA